ncbi:MAG TPA: serine hydrolase [Flavisolibacter sp.]|nr:serine hydrolase [Flavisolibacter sp.]
MLKTNLFVIFILVTLSISAQKIDRNLQKDISAALSNFHGKIGVFCINLKTNKIVSINADTVFPTASMVKIPILIGIMDKINRGELDYHQELLYRDSLFYPGVDILGSFKDTSKIELSKVMMLSLTMSDNTASLWLQSLAGTGTRINFILDSLGFKDTRVNSRTPGRKEAQMNNGWGQTTPHEMAELMKKIVDGEVISKQISSKMIRLLGRNYWDEVAVSQIPSDVFVASKNGAVDESRSEILFVNAKKARYILCVCTKENKDQSWLPSNEAWTLTRQISKLVWDKYGK